LFSLTARGLHPRVPPEQLETQWQLFHVVLILVGYVSLAFAFAASLTYLLQEGLLSAKIWAACGSACLRFRWRTTSFIAQPLLAWAC
jgi:hypothetical protein